jgi:hypothetical protein
MVDVAIMIVNDSPPSESESMRHLSIPRESSELEFAK